VTLRQFLLEQLPLSSKTRRRRIASLGQHQNVKNEEYSLGLKQDTDSDESIRQIVRLLDSTLVGVLKESSPTVIQARQRDFAAFTQSEERSILCTDTGPTCPQAEVRRHLTEPGRETIDESHGSISK
jgi:telomerase reverse transcriptase